MRALPVERRRLPHRAALGGVTHSRRLGTVIVAAVLAGIRCQSGTGEQLAIACQVAFCVTQLPLAHGPFITRLVG
jgi:hypothetical protein